MSQWEWVCPYWADFRTTVCSYTKPAQWSYFVVTPEMEPRITNTMLQLTDFHRLSNSWPPPSYFKP